MTSLAFTCSSRLVLTLALIACVVFSANAAELVRVKRKDGTESQIFQKLITVRDINQVHDEPNDSSKVTRIGPFNVFFHVKTESGDVQQNGFYRVVEDPKDRDDTSKCRWIKPEDVQIWATRFAIKPTRVSKETTFQVDLTAGGKAVYDPEKIPEDATAYSFVLEGGDGAEEENGPFKVALCVARAEDKGTAASLNQLGEMSLEICFVIEDEEYLQNDYKDEGVQFSKYVHDLGQAWKTKVTSLATSGNVPVRFGLVVFADTHPKSSVRTPRVAVPLTDNLDQWLSGLQRVTGQVIYGDYANDGLSGLATAIGTKVGWRENSAKHVVYLGNAPWQKRKLREPEALPMQHYLNFYYDRTDPIGFWKAVGGYEDNFGENTSSMSVSQLLGETYRLGGSTGDELRRNRYLHCIHIGQTVEQQFDKDLLAKVNETDGKFNQILAGKSGNEIVSILVGVEETNPGTIRFCNNLWKVRAFDAYDRMAQSEFEQLARSDSYQGYYTHMNPTGNDVDRVTKELGDKIGTAIRLIADVATGKEEQAMKNKPQSDNEVIRPIFQMGATRTSRLSGCLICG